MHVYETSEANSFEPPQKMGSEYETLKANLIEDIRASFDSQPKERLLNHYCHTHGTGNHDSKSCKRPKDGHILTATAKNKMGGSENVYEKRK